MSRFLRLLLFSLIGLAILVVVFIAGAWVFLSNHEKSRLRQEYGREAVQALALDAALAFPVSKDERLDQEVWLPKDSPCIFSTIPVLRSGNSIRVNGDNWPAGSQPACTDFYVSNSPSVDRSTTIPNACVPVLTFHNQGGPKYSFIVLAAEGVPTYNLSAGQLPHSAVTRLQALERFQTFHRTPKYLRAGGHEHVSMTRTETLECDGFTLFRYLTDIPDLPAMRAQMEQNGYRVGIK